MISSFFEILASLGLFLFGMKIMSEAIQRVAGERLRSTLGSMTKNRFYGVFTGFLVTTMVQSSSATTVMIVSFVNAGLLRLKQAIGLIMGVNLGTTTTFWIISYLGFKFSLSSISQPAIVIGLVLLFTHNEKRRDMGEFFIGFGLLFMGLNLLKGAVPDVHTNPGAFEFVQQFSGYGYGSVLIFFVF
ncbi:MAG: Na/Pi symporter, partial [Verrucomicrobia bacterium]|nr:Na/Pi symporter [Verrucomicrobiota bacterium]